jgi:hypothetical protein
MSGAVAKTISKLIISMGVGVTSNQEARRLRGRGAQVGESMCLRAESRDAGNAANGTGSVEGDFLARIPT